jgi:hypothetical protein
MSKIIQHIDVCAILHNMLIEDEVPNSWIEWDFDDSESRAPENATMAGEDRRLELLQYVV